MNKPNGAAFILRDNVDTDQILPGYAMSYPPERLGEAALAQSEIPDFAKLVKPGDLVIAGENFGCGSSREQAPVALKSSGVGAVVAGSFARIFRRNAINIGLPVLVSPESAKIRSDAKPGDRFEVDIEGARITNATQGKTYALASLAQSSLETLRAGGLMNKVREKLIARGEKLNAPA